MRCGIYMSFDILIIVRVIKGRRSAASITASGGLLRTLKKKVGDALLYIELESCDEHMKDGIEQSTGTEVGFIQVVSRVNWHVLRCVPVRIMSLCSGQGSATLGMHRARRALR